VNGENVSREGEDASSRLFKQPKWDENPSESPTYWANIAKSSESNQHVTP
jgi:hypothetical protein